MSSNPEKIADCHSIPTETPVLTITPATLSYTFPPTQLPTPPETPTRSSSGTGTSPKPILKTRNSTTPISPISPILPPTTPSPPYPHASLHYPLKRHLALIHPSTPVEIINFCAIRLLSTDRPHGYKGPWVPIYQEDGEGVKVDLAAAGVGLDAGKDCVQKGEGRGREVDRRLERMYGAARESWGLLQVKLGGGGSRR